MSGRGELCEPRAGLRPSEASGVHTEGSRTLGNLSLAGGPGIRLGPLSWQTQAGSRKHCSGAPSRLQSEGCGSVGLWKQAGQLAGWAEAVSLRNIKSIRGFGSWGAYSPWSGLHLTSFNLQSASWCHLWVRV